MSHPAVTFVLDTIKNNWSAGSYGDIPLDRINDDDSKNVDAGERRTSEELTAANYVEAAYVDKTVEPIGTEYDLDVDAVVRVQVEGLHVDKGGNVDPGANLPPANAGDPVPFNDVDGLVGAIKDALYADRTFPNAVADYDEKSLVITNSPGPLSYEHADYYNYEFEVLIDGYEDL